MLLAFPVFSQKVEVIAEYQSMIQASDMVVSSTNAIYISGAASDKSMLIKLDSNGVEEWVKLYDYFYNWVPTQINRIQIDKENNLYLHQSIGDTYQEGETFINRIIKVDSNGNELWVSDTIPGSGVRFSVVNMMLNESVLTIVDDSKFDYSNDDAWAMITQLSTETGEVLFQSDPIEGVTAPYINQTPSFVDGYWMLQAWTDVLQVSHDGSYFFNDLENGMSGELVIATLEDQLLFESYRIADLNTFERSRTDLRWYDRIWDIKKEVTLTPKTGVLSDSVSFAVWKMIGINSKGLVAATQTNVLGDSLPYGSASFAQINPDNGLTVWDTVLTYGGGTHIMANGNNYALALEALGASSTGIRLYKIEVPDISYTTEFITDVESIPQNDRKKPITVYPNPTNSTLSVKFNQEQQATISLYSLTGALVLQKQVNATEIQLDVSSLPTGVYVIEAKTENGIETQKVVIEK